MSIIQLQLRQGTEAQRSLVTPLEGELIYTTDTKRIYVGDGATNGGNPLNVGMPPDGTANNSDHVASTKFVHAVINNVTGTDLSDFARKSSPNTFAGLNTFQVNPVVTEGLLPVTENSQKVATTQWVQSLVGGATAANYARRDLPNTFLAQNDFTISPTAPTPPINDNSTRLATTAFVKQAMNNAGLGISTVIITAGTGTSINYSGGTVTLPNGSTVSVSAGTLSLGSNGTYYVVVGPSGGVTAETTYPVGEDHRTIATVTVSNGNITGIDLGGSDLSGYAKLIGAEFTGSVKVPTPSADSDDTSASTTAWVRAFYTNEMNNDPYLVRKNTSNVYANGVVQDLQAGALLVKTMDRDDNSNNAASTAFVVNAIEDAVLDSANIDFEEFMLRTGGTFTGIVNGPTPDTSASDDEYVTAAWVRELMGRFLQGGDIFPILNKRPGTRILDYTEGMVGVLGGIQDPCIISEGDIELPANSEVWIYIDPTCGVNHYPFTDLNTRPPSGKAWAYATTNASEILDITYLPPEYIMDGHLIVDYLTVKHGFKLEDVALDSLSRLLNPPGSMKEFAGAIPPTGWLICQGQSLAVNDYPELFTAIGYTYGGTGDSFKIPDFQGRVAIGAQAGKYELGVKGGYEITTLGVNHLPPHSHTITDKAHSHTASDAGHTHSASDAGHTHTGGDYGHNHTLALDMHEHSLGYSLGNETILSPKLVINTGPNSGRPLPTGQGEFTGVSLRSLANSSALSAAAGYASIYINNGHANISVGNGHSSVSVANSYTGITGTNNAGGGEAFSNMPPYLAINYIIKV